MAFSSGGSGGPMVDMNVTPLVDVMLVLLIIFMVNIPALSYPNAINLPQKSVNPPPQDKDPPPPIELRIDAGGVVYVNGASVTAKQLENQLMSLLPPAMQGGEKVDVADQPVLEIQTDPEAQYARLTEAMAAAKNVGMEKIGFKD